jgi:hypothetical protein
MEHVDEFRFLTRDEYEREINRIFALLKNRKNDDKELEYELLMDEYVRFLDRES